MLKQERKTNLRHEYKYLIHHGAYLQLREILKKVMKIDSNALNNEGYHVRSLYFDDIYDTALKEKALGHANRRKFRIRIYNYSNQIIKLEEKVKHYDFIQKNSCNIARVEYDQIFDGDVAFLYKKSTNDSSDNRVKENYYLEIRNKGLQPKVIVDYYREAYILPYNQIRITFDKNLSLAKPQKNIFNRNLHSYNVGEEYAIILEVKYNNFLPGFLRKILEMYCSNRMAVSKYVLCREYLVR
ncbi:MAG: polyphosphate polymerase domain-containing protein [Halanaerobiales bacterium]|nr:polyphosphate polymerase domain-containing protein [Halanaerobiales bacterium]